MPGAARAFFGSFSFFQKLEIGLASPKQIQVGHFHEHLSIMYTKKGRYDKTTYALLRNTYEDGDMAQQVGSLLHCRRLSPLVSAACNPVLQHALHTC